MAGKSLLGSRPFPKYQMEKERTDMKMKQISKKWAAALLCFMLLVNLLPVTAFAAAPVLSDVTAGPVTVGESISAASSEDGTLYLVPSETAADKLSIETAGSGENGTSVTVTAGYSVSLSTTGFAPGTYVVYAIDEAENVSDPSEAITVNVETSTALYTVTLLGDGKLELSATAPAADSDPYEAVLTLAAGIAISYNLPDAVGLTMGAEGLTAGTDYTYDSATGVITIAATRTANIVVTAAALRYSGGSGTGLDPYQMSTEADLRALASDINDGAFDTAGIYFAQTADIDVASGGDWTPIGGAGETSGNTCFKGDYDGGNHKITGLRFNDGYSGYAGLFGMLFCADGGTVRLANIHLVGPVITSSSSYTGGITAGMNLKRTSGHHIFIIENCVVESGTIQSSASYTGGIIGYAYPYKYGGGDTLAIENCAVLDTDITGGDAAGGIAGHDIEGRDNYINNCLVTGGSVTSSGSAGGIAGRFGSSSSSGTAIVSGCFSTADVNSSGDSVGGLCGYISNCAVNDCYTTGDVTGAYKVGGVIGSVSSSTVQNVFAAGAVTATAEATGWEASGTYVTAGGLFGAAAASENISGNAAMNKEIIHSTDTISVMGRVSGSAAGTVYGNNYAFIQMLVDACLPYTADNGDATGVQGLGVFGDTLKTRTFWESTLGFDFTDVWSWNGGEDDGYPTLQGFDGVAQTVSIPVADITLAITRQPETVLVVGDMESVRFTVGAAGDALTIAYQWQSFPDGESWTNIDRETTPVLTLSPVPEAPYLYYRCVVTDKSGTVESGASTIQARYGGDGTEESPYELASEEDLLNFGEEVSENSNGCNGKYYKVTADIALASDAGNAWEPISTFQGSFDGGGFIISGLYVVSDSYGGLFSEIDGAEIKNVNIANATIYGVDDSAILVGHALNSNISDCSVQGYVYTTGCGGGLVGYFETKSAGDYAITGCCADVIVAPESGRMNGGIAGYFYIKSPTNTFAMSNCYATGIVAATTETGGLVGDIKRSGTSTLITVENCYSSVAVNVAKSPDRSYGSGGLVGNIGISSTIGAPSQNLILQNNVALGDISFPYAAEEHNLGRIYNAEQDLNTDGNAVLDNYALDSIKLAGSTVEIDDASPPPYHGTSVALSALSAQAFWNGIGYDFGSEWTWSAGGYPMLTGIPASLQTVNPLNDTRAAYRDYFTFDIVTQPQPYSAGLGFDAYFTVLASGNDLAYNWQVSADDGANWSDITDNASASTSELVIPGVTNDLNGNTYRCVLTSTFNGVSLTKISGIAALYVGDATIDAPTIREQPVGAQYLVGAEDLNELRCLGSGSVGQQISYQWYVSTDGENYAEVEDNSSDQEYYLHPQSLDEEGTLYYYCRVTATMSSGSGDTLSAYTDSDVAELTFRYSYFDGSAYWDGSGTAAEPYLIVDMNDLIELRDLVNGGESLLGCVFKMTGDIILPDDWAPIGDLTEGAVSPEKGKSILPFSGVFDGGEHNVTVPADGLPLFNYLREGYIKNLKIYGERIAGHGLIDGYVVDYGADGNYNTGCPAFTADIENVTLLTGSSTLYSGFIGGYASGANYVSIRNSVIEDNVTIGYSRDQDCIGSFAGEFNGAIINCVSYADVYGTDYVGGLVAIKGQSMGYFTISNSSFHGMVEATGNYAGGIAGGGYNAPSAPNTPCADIQNCYVTGSVTGGDHVGGIFGGEPVVLQAWGNGVGYIQNNHFAGTLAADEGALYVGGVIGYMRSLNSNNVISNNFFLEGSGAEKAIGYIALIDTSCKTVNTDDSTVEYTDTSAAVTPKNRTDDPIGADADKLARAATAAEMSNGTVTDLLNSGENSYHNWIQGGSYPEISSEPVAYLMTLSGGYKTEYVVGETFNTDGMIITLTYTDGATQTISPADATITGYDKNTRGVQTITVTYSACTASYTVRVLYDDPSDTSITVYFTLLGDEDHLDTDQGGPTHGLAMGGLQTWIPETTYTVNINATAEDVFRQALGDAGIEFEGDSNNQYNTLYISGIKSPRTGDWIKEFTNGPDSGWMFTVKGKHGNLGLAQQFLDDEDRIVFHYTDDWKKESDTQKWIDGGAGGGTDGGTVLNPKVTTHNGAASASVSKSDIDDILKEAEENGTTNIKIDAKTTQSVTKSSVTIPAGSTSDMANAGLSVTIETSTGTFDLDNNALKSIAGAGSGSVELSAEQLGADNLSDANKELVGDHPVFDLNITVGGTNVTDFGDGTVTVSLPYTPADGENTDNLTVYYIDADGNAVKMDGAYYDEDTGSIVFETDHFSTFAVVYEQSDTVFIDVTTDDWYYDEVMYVFENGLMNGTSDTLFSPEVNMTRAMLVTVLYRLEGEPHRGGEITSTYSDVDDDEWYSEPVLWANHIGIVSGYGNGLFGTNDSVTRQQMAVILYNYAVYKGYDTTASSDLAAYTDAGDISDWAVPAMRWANAEGLITGVTETTLNPSGSATRAQVATILMRFVMSME